MDPAKSVVVALTLASVAAVVPASDVARSARAAVPVDAVPVILEAARSRPLVALSEGQHWNEQGHRFRLGLIRDPRFAATFDDIVVEFGSARYQEVMDRFIAGEVIDQEQLRHAWQDTTQPNEVWDIPIYEEFFRAVRELNASRAKDRRMRVLLADPPIDWNAVKGKDDILRWMDQRDAHAADLVRTQVVDRKRRALLIFGDGHLFRKAPQATVVSLLSRGAPDAVFNIAAPTSADLPRMQAEAADWPAPSIALLKDTVLGAAPFGPFYGLRAGSDASATVQGETVPMEEQFDALLYLGAAKTITLADVSRARCTDQAYMSMRLGRMALVPWGQSQIDRLKRVCLVDRIPQ